MMSMRWLGRWESCDPAGLADGTNVCSYANNNPILHRDSSGHQSSRPSQRTAPTSDINPRRPEGKKERLFKKQLMEYEKEAEWRAENPEMTETAEMTAARIVFVTKNEELGADELARIVSATSAATLNNPDLQLAFYRYYSEHRILKDKSDDKKYKHGFARTEPYGDTTVQPKLLADRALGTVLFHELVHTRDPDNYSGAYDFLEGNAYGAEYFLARRTGNDERAETIKDLILRHPKTLTSSPAALQQLFNERVGALTVLYEVIDTGSSPHKDSPLATLTTQQARDLVVELFTAPKERYSASLKETVKWVAKNLASIKPPSELVIGDRPR